jgi:hypothetical protein
MAAARRGGELYFAATLLDGVRQDQEIRSFDFFGDLKNVATLKGSFV